MIIQISNQQDMQTVAVILFKNGYTVRQQKMKNAAGKAVTYLVAERDGAAHE